MYKMIEYSSNHSETTGSLWFYPKDKATNFNNGIENLLNYQEVQLQMEQMKLQEMQ